MIRQILSKGIRSLIVIVLLGLLLAIALPSGQKLSYTIAGKRQSVVIHPITINTNIFGKQIKKTFETKFGLDIQGGSHLVFETDTKKIPEADRADAVEASRDIIEKRVNFFGVSEPNVYTSRSNGRDRIVVDLPGYNNVKEAVSLIGQTAQLSFKELPSKDTKIATDTPIFFQLTKDTGLTGKDVKKATVQYDPTDGKPVVALAFSTEGGKLFERITERNIGLPIGIFIDNMPVTYPPVVRQKISDGKGVISGDFTTEEAKALATSINSGALPVSINLIEQRNIGPSLGQDQVKKSVYAGLVGLGMVMAFMLLCYGRLGIISVVALLLYGLLSLALFRAIPVVLTLPGLAGFILSIGMAVDSNILIFERIKEELRKGQPKSLAIQLGFGRAIDAIKDANITTLLVAFILFNPFNWNFFPQFGMVRGFALTLAIGVATSLFTGVVITKRLITTFYKA